MDNIVYFNDNFFSSGTTEIYTEDKAKTGELDLKSMFSSGVEVLDENNKMVVAGKFPFLSRKWEVTNENSEQLGLLKETISFFQKTYEYKKESGDVYYIESPAFSLEYTILDERKEQVAKFEKISVFFASPAFKLTNRSTKLSTEELVAVVMGVNAIQKRKRSASGGGAAGGAS
ncbi:hypothetical protein [Pseudalkalibacillus caeni]|uniref:Uncharacterized protein n=1 Tax=Exobacillus caeni TaxID=2574798 RepID=A0A5R9F7H7_9BACL|nr:hypothetical protein [Pseudalkalibacillus caeni]TLS38286.1 hypothetical protein FCL54_07095 [Pseudalkalibacillus caeni]